GADAGPAAAAPTHEHHDEPPTHGEHADVDAGPAAPSLHDRLVGTWSYDEGPIKNVYALCDDGAYAVHFEAGDPTMASLLDDLPVVHGKWEAVDGASPKISFSALGDTMEAPIGLLTDDALDITLDSEQLHL